MLRYESLDEITDGEKYGIDDMVRANAGGCKGCSKCCETMTDTIILSPLDVHRISVSTGKDFDALLEGGIELNMHDGVILPNIGSDSDGCVFLSKEKRCTIHENRPDFCRLFPLGRLYEGDSFTYILQSGQCKASCSKVKVKKWIDTKDYERNSKFVLSWHNIIRTAGKKVFETSDPDRQKKIVMGIIQEFYRKPFDENEDFYDEFERRAEVYMSFLSETDVTEN